VDFSSVLRLLYRGPRGDAPQVVNPYREAFAELDGPAAARRRRENLEAYLDRTFGSDWNAGPHADTPPPERAPPGMTRTEALKVLGLTDGAGEDEIRAAHRRLMLQNHPDRGGTDYLASKINEAKDFLLGD